MMATATRTERTHPTPSVGTNQSDIDQMIRAAIETLTPTPSAPEWAKAESLRNVGNGYGGPY